MVVTILEKVIKANKLDMSVPEVKLVHDENLILFMNMEGTLFLTIKCLNVSEHDEAKLALLVCHELSHYLLDH